MISIGDLLRGRQAQDDEIGAAVRSATNAGALVTDWIVNQILAERLAQPDASAGFVLDGYPRIAGQDETLDIMLAALPAPTRLDLAIHLALDASVAIRRVQRRLVCNRCLRPFSRDDGHVRGRPCPLDCGGRLSARPDDRNEVALRRRIDSYLETTVPLIEAYARRGLLKEVDAGGENPDAVFAQVRRAVERSGQ